MHPIISHRGATLGRTALALALLAAAGCVAPALPVSRVAPPVPRSFVVAADMADAGDTTSIAALGWRTFFEDSALIALIDTAVGANPEMLTTLQEVEIARNEVRSVRGRLAPQLSAVASLGLDKSARFTSEGAGNASTDITEGTRVPEPLPDIALGFTAAWEADIRGKIRNQKGAALARYLSSVEGSRYVMTGLVAEVANSYYELAALDAKLAIVRQAIELQRNELEVVRAQREAAAVSELAVQQFQALLLNAQGLEYELRQQIRETENRMNFLLGRYPQPVPRTPVPRTPVLRTPVLRTPASLSTGGLRALDQGLPSQLLRNRPDIRQAEFALKASRFDVKAARAEFYPVFNLAAGLGVRAFRPGLLLSTPESKAYSLASDLMAPLMNRAAIKAEFGRASAAQQQALLNYRRTILGGVTEVSTLVSSIGNLDSLYAYKSQQAEALDRSASIASDLFNAARANYLEVLTAQREAIDVKLELVETRLRQRLALTGLYRALGGGWR